MSTARSADIKSPHDAIALGIGMVHQHFMLVETMTVAENIVLGAEPGSAFALDLKSAAAQIRQLSEEFKLAVNPNEPVEHLSVGQQQRVELLKALYRQARLLILDEPTAVLTPLEVDEFFGILRRMREQGKTVIIITHKLSEVLAISDEVTVMRDGKVVGRVQTKDTNAAELARMMVGREVLLRVEKPEPNVGATALEVRNLSVLTATGAKRVDEVSFEVRSGEIVGIAGVEGNGQTELIEALAGLVDPAQMTGRDPGRRQKHQRISARVCGANSASRTSLKTGIAAACCSNSVWRKTRFSAFTTGRRSRRMPAACFSTRTRSSAAQWRSLKALMCVRQTPLCPRVRFRAATSRS